MEILNKTIQYRPGIPVEASLCRVDRALPHRHPSDLEIVCCLEGKVHLVASDQQATLLPGQIHSIDHEDIHYLYSDTENLVLIFHLDLKNIPYDWDQIRYVFFACESNHCYAYQQTAMDAVKDTILSFSYGYLTGDYTPEMYEGPVEFFSFYLLEYFNWFNYENQDVYMNEDLYERFHRVLAYCMDHYDQKITISQLAAQEHISKNYFSQFISHTVFRSFSTMIKYIRCYNAEYLLLTTDKPNAEIAYECGFSDPKYFYAAFRQLWGRTPSEHRAAYENYYRSCLEHYAKSERSENAENAENAKAGGVMPADAAEGAFSDALPVSGESHHFPLHGDEIPGQKRLSDEDAAHVLRSVMADWHLKKTFGPEESEQDPEAERPRTIYFAERI